MKKIFLMMAMFSAMFVSCTNEELDDLNSSDDKNIKASELIVSSGEQVLATRAGGALGYDIPDNGRYQVHYYIRIDGNLPGEGDNHFSSGDYFPRKKDKKTLLCNANMGYVTANVDWKSCASFSKYIYSKDGSAVQSIIVEEPTIKDLLECNQLTTDDMAGYIEHQDELHFIWYVCKKQDADHSWHIDGILTTKDKTTIDETDYGKEIVDNYNEKNMISDEGDVTRKAHIEVDIHQQQHKDWNEIKTSIHMRDTVDVEVFLPIGYEEMADDFNIRAGKDYEYITEIMNTSIQIAGKTYQLEASIKHETDGIRIILKPNAEALKAAREAYQDGITYEVHSYVTSNITNEAIWERLKKATCTVSPYTTIYGQITSAFYEDWIDLSNK